MDLSTFIQSHMEAILAEWDIFARTSEPHKGVMSDKALRDHAQAMLSDIAREMNTAQSERERQLKSEGLEPKRHAGHSAATKHGRERHSNDFSLATLSAEFRALRATVLRLWQPHMGRADAAALEQVIRFNEGIDKALAESITAWSDRTSHYRELFLAILGHDLRSPLAGMALTAEVLSQPAVSAEQADRAAQHLKRAGSIMSSMIDDLIGYTRTQLGGSLPYTPTSCDLLLPLRDAIQDASATYPRASFEFSPPASTLVGHYDGGRLYQMFLNLLVNAARHSRKNCPVRVEISEAGGSLEVAIANQGEPIPAASLESIFKPLVQLDNVEAGQSKPRTSLGLGLYIARMIAELHGGAITVSSSQADGTCFRIALPH